MSDPAVFFTVWEESADAPRRQVGALMLDGEGQLLVTAASGPFRPYPRCRGGGDQRRGPADDPPAARPGG